MASKGVAGQTLRVVGKIGDAEVVLLNIEFVESNNNELEGTWHTYNCQLTVDRGNGTVGIHQRTTYFDPRANAIELLREALDLFSDVTDKEPVVYGPD